MAAARIDGALVYPNLPAIVADRNGIRTLHSVRRSPLQSSVLRDVVRWLRR